MADLTYTFKQPIRGMEVDGETWFFAWDVAEAFGYEDPSAAIDKHCRHARAVEYQDDDGATRTARVIPQSDESRLLVHSKDPAVESFIDWLCENVLPRHNRCVSDGQE